MKHGALSRITNIVNDRIYEPTAAKSQSIHETLQPSVEKIHSNPLVANVSNSPVVDKIIKPVSNSPNHRSSIKFSTQLYMDKVKSSSILSKPYYKVECFMD